MKKFSLNEKYNFDFDSKEKIIYFEIRVKKIQVFTNLTTLFLNRFLRILYFENRKDNIFTFLFRFTF